jgi:hypothetical protein
MTIQDLESCQHTAHASTLAAGKGGCVLLLPMASLILFFGSASWITLEFARHSSFCVMSCENDLIQDDLFVVCSYFKPKEDVKTYK